LEEGFVVMLSDPVDASRHECDARHDKDSRTLTSVSMHRCKQKPKKVAIAINQPINQSINPSNMLTRVAVDKADGYNDGAGLDYKHAVSFPPLSNDCFTLVEAHNFTPRGQEREEIIVIENGLK